MFPLRPFLPSPPPLAPGKRGENLCLFERAFVRADRRRSRALFCASPFCGEAPALFSFAQLLFDTKRRSFSLSRPRCARSSVRFPGLRVPLSRPVPFSSATLYLHPSRRFFKVSSFHRLIPSSEPILLSLLFLPPLPGSFSHLAELYSFHPCDRPACVHIPGESQECKADSPACSLFMRDGFECQRAETLKKNEIHARSILYLGLSLS